MQEYAKLLVGFVNNCSSEKRNSIHGMIGGKCVNHFPQINVDVVECPKEDIHKMIEQYKKCKEVRYAETSKKTYSPSFRPNDPFYRNPTQTSGDGLQSQWFLRRIGSEQAWDRVRNLQPSQIIAILDTGIDPDHPDLANKIVQPINFTTADPNDYIDRIGHGTHVAGIAAAITNNATGVAGVSFNTANIMPVKVLGDDGRGSDDDIIQGIMYATDNGASVINMSLGGPYYNQAVQDAVNYAWQRGVVIVVAAGNDGNEQVEYPAGYNFVLAVSATNQNNQKATFSNWGVNVGVAAPGVAILSTTPTYPTDGNLENYDALQGTSMAAPVVAGLAVMLRAIYPQLSNQQIIQVIQSSADMIQDTIKEWGPFFGYGLVDADRAVKRTNGHAIKIITGQNTGRRTTGKRSPGKRLRRTQFGSFYGQVVDANNGMPVGGVRIIAQRQGTTVAQYVTKTNVRLAPDGTVTSTDGMFRLANLPAGTYTLFYQFPLQPFVQIQNATIVPGADVYLQLVIN